MSELLSKIHPLADALPLLEGAEYDALVEDIREHGQRVPILTTWDGITVIDGRNRLRACRQLGIEPRFGRLRPTGAFPDESVVVAAIRSLNLMRRNLSKGQRYEIGGVLAKEYAKEAKEEQRLAAERTNRMRKAAPDETVRAELHEAPLAARRTDNKVAKEIGVSPRNWALFDRLTPALQQEVKADRMTVHKANKVMQQQQDEERAQQDEQRTDRNWRLDRECKAAQEVLNRALTRCYEVEKNFPAPHDEREATTLRNHYEMVEKVIIPVNRPAAVSDQREM